MVAKVVLVALVPLVSVGEFVALEALLDWLPWLHVGLIQSASGKSLGTPQGRFIIKLSSPNTNGDNNVFYFGVKKGRVRYA